MSYEASPRILTRLDQLLSLPAVTAALDWIRQDQPRSIQEQKRLTLSEAPTFHEAARARAFADALRALGLEDVRVDDIGNVTGVRRGSSRGPTVLIEAHMDTVFPLGSVMDVREEDGFLHAPGVSDDTRGLAVILALLRALNAAHIATDGTLILAGTTREEGAGGMAGMKALLQALPGLDAAISIDSGDLGGIICEATGMRTVEITFRGKGGHAFGAFGQVAQPLHAAARAVAKIAEFQVPHEPRTTFCVSNFHAGNDAGIHAIPPTATIKVNYRSNDPAELEALHGRVFQAVREACEEETARWGRDAVTWEAKTHCDIPAGAQDTHMPVAEGLWAVLDHLGVGPRFLRGGATNCSIAIGAGIPAVCMGTCCCPGDEAVPTFDHTLEERYPVAGAYRGVQAALLLSLLCAGTAGAPSILTPHQPTTTEASL